MLPHATLEDAAASLGRNLTMAESMWFNYSATKTDYFLYCHIILFLFIVQTIVPLPFALMALAQSTWFDKHKIQPKKSMSPAEMFRCYKDVICLFCSFLTPFLLVSYFSVKIIGIRTGLPLPAGWEVSAQLVVYLMIDDYANYWIHRFLHSVEWIYNIVHRTHHEYEAPIGFAALHAHWTEVLILGFPVYLGPAIVPGHMLTLWLWLVLRQIEAIQTHTGYNFPWSPTKLIPFYADADRHDYHHKIGAQSSSDFASVFTYCDYIYGTDKGYRYYKKALDKVKEETKGKTM